VTCCVVQVLNLLDQPNKILQSEDTDLSTGMQLVLTAVQCIEDLRSDKHLEYQLSTVPNTPDVPAKRQRFASTRLPDCIVYETTGVNATNNVKLRRLYYSVLDHILREMSARFNERNSKLARALVSLDTKSDTFLRCVYTSGFRALQASKRLLVLLWLWKRGVRRFKRFSCVTGSMENGSHATLDARREREKLW